MGLHRMADRLGRIEALDRLAAPLDALAQRAIPKGRVKDVLSGTWLGHALHPMLTDIPIGSFTSASVLDLLGGRRAQPAADGLVGLGLVSAVPTAAAGLSDWSDTYGPDKRVGVAHAVANLIGLALYGASLVARIRGRRGAGTTLGLAAMGVMTAGGYLGGDLSYARGVGVNNAFWQHAPEDWAPVLDEAALPEGKPVKAEASGTGVLLYRTTERILAISSRCSHAGGPLHDGSVDPATNCVTCPWHQSVFRLEDGSVVHGPATVPQTGYEARARGGKVEVRARS
ncbi:MAG: Rieske 2Fe-2S domain-containing protein [Acidimicrobiales bacterium]